MEIVADLHLHSYLSRATSKNLNFEYLTKWSQLKGITVAATGDIAHPTWLAEMRKKLEPAEEGLFRLKSQYAAEIGGEVPRSCRSETRFMIAGEISNIYKKGGKVRKIHHVVFLSNLDAVERFQNRLDKIGNIRSDGRPILGLPSRDLLEIVLETDEQGYIIPAHVWTPWFALFGSKSGYDDIEECFEDLTPHIFALETGLSSDPPMNWRLSALDKYTFVSNSDAHSPPKLGREATLFDTELNYPAIFGSLKEKGHPGFKGTIEFYSEEGKYHMDGHRKCGIRWDPKTTKAHDRICPECGKPVTVGVMHRIDDLADRDEAQASTRRAPFYSLIPLPEILSEILEVGVNSKKVQTEYQRVLKKLGPELNILKDLSTEKIYKAGGAVLAEAITRMRNEQVIREAGYDGEYGVIKLFAEGEKEKFSGQFQLFSINVEKGEKSAPINEQVSSKAPLTLKEDQTEGSADGLAPTITSDNGLNKEQQQAVETNDVHVIITAGPGTGKTRTLTHRIANLVESGMATPQEILAITFTNRAAEEMRDRLVALLSEEAASRLSVSTFHAFGVSILREFCEAANLPNNFQIASEEEREAIIKSISGNLKKKDRNKLGENIASYKNGSQPLENHYTEYLEKYQALMRDDGLLDFEDLLFETNKLFEGEASILTKIREKYRWVSVDEYQDINPVQHTLLKHLVGPETNLCAIGDPDQAIYSFRGSNRKYFASFTSDFPRAVRLTLNRNYRSAQYLLKASGQVIASEPADDRTTIWSNLIAKKKISTYTAPTEKAEAEFTVHEIEKMIGGTSYFSFDTDRVGETEQPSFSFSDFAVLYRLNSMADNLVEAFVRSGIPFQCDSKERINASPASDLILAILKALEAPESVIIRGQLCDLTQHDSEAVPTIMDEFTQGIDTDSTASDLIKRAAKLPVVQEADINPDEIARLSKLAEQSNDSLPEMLARISLMGLEEAFDPNTDRVSLMSLHASKGLEFPVVFIIGCDEGTLPYRRPDENLTPEQINEERRLLYVGMTRAKERLFLSRARKRLRFGKLLKTKPSRYLADIDAALREKVIRENKPKKSKGDDEQLTLF